jgi:hypothetical protein
MGIYLGQLPPAEIARLKAELAETLIANFCYPRFFDSRTESLRMRPVDRAKRQEVWLYLSSFDFTAWNRVDLMSPDFQYYIERLFIQFVQRNRSFFGEQGRRRMADIRQLIGSSASSVVQGLRTHLSGQKQGTSSFGSPRAAISWSAGQSNGRSDPGWEQISASTMLLQQQLQEVRGEMKPAAQGDGRATNGQGMAARSALRSPQPAGPAGKGEGDVFSSGRGNVAASSSVSAGRNAALNAANASAAPVRIRKVEGSGGASPLPTPPPATPRRADAPVPPPATPRKAEMPVSPPSTPMGAPAASARAPAMRGTSPLPETTQSSLPAMTVQGRGLAPSAPAMQSAHTIAAGQRSVANVGEDDIAIFEQMRHQLLVWLRIEAVRAGLEIANQGPAQLLEMLRQHAHLDETRLQVVSTLLNLSTQVIKTGNVSILDYKQALMFHLMHTRG